jgi:hypothetical protein
MVGAPSLAAAPERWADDSFVKAAREPQSGAAESVYG